MSIQHIDFFKILTYAFAAVIIGIAVLFLASTFPIPGNYQLYVVDSGSMEPAIRTGAMVLVKPQGEYKIGDVVTFVLDRRDEPVTHRIYDISVSGGIPLFLTKGDANEEPDAQQVRQRDIIGKVLVDVPFVGYAIAAAKNPIGFVALIVIPAALLILDQLYQIFKEARRMIASRQKQIPKSNNE
jgi:signal peptidase I